VINRYIIAAQAKRDIVSKMTAKPSNDKPSKKRRHDDDDAPSKESKSPKHDKATDKDKLSKQDKKAQKKAKESHLLSQIPTHDPDGIPYNKIQIRRMKRRVKHGLNPIPTEEEEREIQKRVEEEKREVEELFADRTEKEEDDNVDDGSGNEEDGKDDGDSEEEPNDDNNKPAKTEPIYKKARTKPVPSDYICSACQNKCPNFTPHWIYDCPSKITQKGCNTKSKKIRGLHDPASRKVFVSGLPFDVTERGVKGYFEKVGEVVHVKLLKFEDSQRCKGQGILTFDTDGGARAALKLNGEVWVEEESSSGGGGKKKKKKEEKKEGKELRLKVSKVLNRFVTKKQKKG
jgi:hypothetical protein